MSCVNFVPPGGVSSTQPQIASKRRRVCLIEQMAGASRIGTRWDLTTLRVSTRSTWYSVVQQRTEDQVQRQNLAKANNRATSGDVAGIHQCHDSSLLVHLEPIRGGHQLGEVRQGLDCKWLVESSVSPCEGMK
jgi:hypothetical protein